MTVHLWRLCPSGTSDMASANSETAPRETTPPQLQSSDVPDAKQRKFDRQLRLWAAAGQKALEESHVLLVAGDGSGSNSSVAGVETLKNLVLPNVGHFTIADSATVTESDLGINFFLEPGSLGKSRAEETRRYLQELNPDVLGHSISESLSEWLPKQNSLLQYNLIIVCAPLPQEYLQRLSTYALEQSIPLMYMKSQGFYFTASVQLPAEFPIVDTHPDPDTIQDLRLLAPWGDLKAVEAELGDLTALADHEHGHVPWLLILLHYLEEWKQSRSGNYPSSFSEKKEFQKVVASKARTSNPEGGEENFDEAVAAVLKSLNPPQVGSGCKEMFKMESCTNLSQSSANFWLVANAIKQFYEKHSVLPLPGGLPDMKATSQGYINLQTIYKTKARNDVAEVTETVRKLESSLSRTSQITAIEIEQFCKNASFVRVLTNPTKQSIPELRLLNHDSKTLAQLPDMLTSYNSISEIFLAFNADIIPSSTVTELKNLEDEIEGGTLEERITNAIEEVKRSEGAELHNTSSIAGGMVAQEAIKLLTRQYVPVDGVVIWDGIRARTEVVKI